MVTSTRSEPAATQATAAVYPEDHWAELKIINLVCYGMVSHFQDHDVIWRLTYDG